MFPGSRFTVQAFLFCMLANWVHGMAVKDTERSAMIMGGSSAGHGYDCTATFNSPNLHAKCPNVKAENHNTHGCYGAVLCDGSGSSNYCKGCTGWSSWSCSLSSHQKNWYKNCCYWNSVALNLKGRCEPKAIKG